jgi:hypothetical protein
MPLRCSHRYSSSRVALCSLGALVLTSTAAAAALDDVGFTERDVDHAALAQAAP